METNGYVGGVPITVPTAEPREADRESTGVAESVVADNATVHAAEGTESPVPAERPQESGTVTENRLVCQHCGRVISDEDTDFFVTHDDKTICGDCYSEHYFTCEDCGKVYPSSESVDVSNGSEERLVCTSCSDDHWRRCHDCDKWFNIDDDGRCVDCIEDYVCDNCLDMNYSRCEWCEEYFPDGDGRSVHGGGYVCESCYEDHYFTCERCGEVFHADNMVTENDLYLCESCAEEEHYRNDNHRVMDYHAGRRNHLYEARSDADDSDDERLFFGVELECEKGDFDPDGFDDWLDDGNLVHFESDGSLDDGGVEMITQPCTLLYHQRRIGWDRLCAKLIGQGFCSHNAENCGLHVHLSRRAIRPTTIVKMDVFINRACEFWKQVARRDTFYGHGGRYDEMKMASLAKGNFARGDCQGERYTAVNTNNGNTVEIRIFKGTLKTETVLGTIEILHGLVKFLDGVPIPRIYETEKNVVKFIDFLADSHERYPHVFPMLRRLIRRNDGWKKRIGNYYGQFCESRNDGENN